LTNARKDPSKDALSRALGAAFLSHKVEELEKTVSTSPNYGGFQAREKRERRLSPTLDFVPRGRGGRGRGGSGRPPRGGRPRGADDEYKDERRNGMDNKVEEPTGYKDADVVIVDASVLIHAIGQVKAWSKYGREETIIVPLEALNTLDLLKKGSSVLAQRARAASRILEQQVGTNPRIKVQQDDAFVLWDEMSFALETSTNESKETNPDSQADQETPEWLRRTISCARWELEKSAEVKDGSASEDQPFNVVVAVCTSPLEAPTSGEVPTTTRSPVPLPAPQPPSKFEQRCAGILVSQWAKAAGIRVLDVKATAPPHGGPPGGRRGGGANHVRSSSDEEWRGGPSSSRKSYAQAGRGGRGAPRDSVVGKPPVVYGPGRVGGALVERPAATVALNATLMEPAKVIRVLARGEKLEP